MVGWYLGEERAQNRANHLHQRVHDPRILRDLEKPEEERQHPDETQRDLRRGLGEVERGGGDGVELDEPHGLEHDGGAATLGLQLPHPPLQLVVSRLADFRDARQRLRQIRLGVEAKLGTFLALEEVPLIIPAGRFPGAVERGVCRRIDPDLHRHSASVW
jgi:hypothetical protein